jgi:hypothetical protein
MAPNNATSTLARTSFINMVLLHNCLQNAGCHLVPELELNGSK